MTDDPLKHTPACELDRDNRVMTREAEGERAVTESLRAEVERLNKLLTATEGSLRLICNELCNARIRALDHKP